MATKGVPQHRRTAPQRDGWKEHAACGTPDIDPKLFDTPEDADKALQVCSECAVRIPCGASRPRGMEGVYGGTAFYPARVGRPRRVICPVCRQSVATTKQQLAATHTDKTGHLCPMSGHPITGTER